MTSVPFQAVLVLLVCLLDSTGSLRPSFPVQNTDRIMTFAISYVADVVALEVESFDDKVARSEPVLGDGRHLRSRALDADGAAVLQAGTADGQRQFTMINVDGGRCSCGRLWVDDWRQCTDQRRQEQILHRHRVCNNSPSVTLNSLCVKIILCGRSTSIARPSVGPSVYHSDSDSFSCLCERSITGATFFFSGGHCRNNNSISSADLVPWIWASDTERQQSAARDRNDRKMHALPFNNYTINEDSST